MDIGARIKKIRSQKELSTYELSKLVGVSQSTISKLENGKRKADNIIIEKLAEALGVSPDRLTGESVSSIIENRIDQLNINIEEVAERSGVPLHWLQNIDTFTPGEFGEYEIGYDWITKVADVLDLPASMLRAALARQEIPLYEGPETTILDAKKAFEEPINDITPEKPEEGYYLNEETREIAQEIYEKPEMKALFDMSQKIPPERLRAHLEYLEKLFNSDNTGK